MKRLVFNLFVQNHSDMLFSLTYGVNFDGVFVFISEQIVKFDLDQNILFTYKISDNDNINIILESVMKVYHA